MSDIGTNGSVLSTSRIDAAAVIVTTAGVERRTPNAVANLLGDRLAVNPSGVIAVCARTAADRAYGCMGFGPWIDLGRTAQPVCVWWVGGRFVFALVGPGGGMLVEQEIVNGGVRPVKSTPIPGGTSQGLLYYDEGTQQFIVTSQAPVVINGHTLYHAVRRLVNGQWIYHGQHVAYPRDVNYVAGAGVGFVSGPQKEIPQLVAIGSTLYTNEGVAWPVPYPSTLPPTKPPIEPPVIPPVKPPIKPPIPPVEPPVPPTPTPSTLTLRAMNGQYVCAEPDGRLVANRDAVGGWETFGLESRPGGLVALKTAHGKYICAEGGGGGVLIANRDSAGPWESFKQHQVGQGVALETSDGHYWCAENGGGGEVNASRVSIGAWETFNSQSPTPIPPGPVPGLRGQLKAKGETIVDAAGLRFDWLGVTAFRLVELVATGREDEAAAWLQWASGAGYNVQRVLTMCAAAPDGGMFRLTPADGLAALPRTLELCAAFGQYVEVVALAATERFGFDEAACRKHLRAVAAVCAVTNNTTLQIANEYEDGSHCKWLEGDIAHVHALSSEIPNGVLYTESPPNGDDDEHEFPKGLYVTRHRARKDKWNNARRIIELERLAGKVKLPMIDDEPSGAAEKPRGNSRFNDPAFFYAQGLLTKFHNIAGTTLHSEDGLYARVPGPVQQSCAKALIEGFRFPVSREYRFENAKHSTSPVKDADFKKVCRVFSFLHPSGSWAVALGVTGDPKIQWQNGYRPIDVLMPYGKELLVIKIDK